MELYPIEQRRSSSSEEDLCPEEHGKLKLEEEEETKKKKQKLEEIVIDSSQEVKEELELEDTTTTTTTTDSSQEEEEKKKKQKLEDIISESSPDDKQKLEEINSDDSCFEEEYSDTNLSHSDSAEDEDENEDEDEDEYEYYEVISPEPLSMEERLKRVYNRADYSTTEEWERVIRDHLSHIKAYEEEEEEEARRRMEKKTQLPEDKIKSHGWYGIVMADDSDGYSDAEDRAVDLRKYHQQVKDSGGFDVESFPKARLCSMITPVQVKGSGSRKDNPLLGKLSCTAIRKFNRDHGREYRFNRVIKSTSRCCAGFVYYITFEATEADSTATFKSSVYLKIGGKVQVMQNQHKDDVKGQ